MATKETTGMQCRVKKLTDRDFVGFIIAVEDGRYLWSKHSGIRRLSRVDAMRDAHVLAHENIVNSFAG